MAEKGVMAEQTGVAAVDEPEIDAWERRSDWPLTILAVLFLVAYATSVLVTNPTPTGRLIVDIMLWGTWALFAVDYLARLWLARRKWRFVRRHLLDLAIIVLPILRQLRALRLLTVITVLNRRLRDDFRGRVTLYVVGTTALIAFVASLAVLDAERVDPDASITSFGDAVWWTITTLSTVGYGDRYPVTTEGRVVGGALMIGGIALLGVVTASMASWFVQKVQGVREEVQRSEENVGFEVGAVLGEVRELNDRLRGIEQRLQATQTSSPQATSQPTNQPASSS